MFRNDFLNLIYESKFSYSDFGEIVTKKNFFGGQIRMLVTSGQISRCDI